MYIRALLLSLMLSVTGGSAFAKGGVIVWSGDAEHFHKVADLPDTNEFMANKDYIDLGVLYKGVELFLIPIWQYDKQYVGLIPDDPDSYYEISERQAIAMAKSAGITVPPAAEVKLSFWTAWGGKILLAALVILVIVGLAMRDDEDEEGIEEKAQQ